MRNISLALLALLLALAGARPAFSASCAAALLVQPDGAMLLEGWTEVLHPDAMVHIWILDSSGWYLQSVHARTDPVREADDDSDLPVPRGRAYYSELATFAVVAGARYRAETRQLEDGVYCSVEFAAPDPATRCQASFSRALDMSWWIIGTTSAATAANVQIVDLASHVLQVLPVVFEDRVEERGDRLPDSLTIPIRTGRFFDKVQFPLGTSLIYRAVVVDGDGSVLCVEPMPSPLGYRPAIERVTNVPSGRNGTAGGSFNQQ